MPVALFFLWAVGCRQPPTATSSPGPASAAVPSAGIELLSGPPGSCVQSDETQSTAVGFEVRYHHVTAAQYMAAVLTGPQGEVLGTAAAPGEGREGEGGWGLYPRAYALPAHTPLTLALRTHDGPSEQAPILSESVLRYDCTTGQALAQSYRRP